MGKPFAFVPGHEKGRRFARRCGLVSDYQLRVSRLVGPFLCRPVGIRQAFVAFGWVGRMLAFFLGRGIDGSAQNCSYADILCSSGLLEALAGRPVEAHRQLQVALVARGEAAEVELGKCEADGLAGGAESVI